MMRFPNFLTNSIFMLFIVLESAPGWGATVPLGRANPFKPLISKPLIMNRSALPALPDLAPIEPLKSPPPAEALPRLVGIIADERGGLAALRLNGKTEFLRPREIKRNVHLLSLGKNQAIVEVEGKPLRLFITGPMKTKKIEE